MIRTRTVVLLSLTLAGAVSLAPHAEQAPQSAAASQPLMSQLRWRSIGPDRQTKNQSGQDPLNFPIRINNRIAALNRVVNAGDGKPIAVAYEIFKDVTAELKVQTDRLAQVLAKDLAAFNMEARRAGVVPIEVSGK